MVTLLKVLGGLAAFIVLLVAGLAAWAMVGSARQAQRADALLEPVTRALQEGRAPDSSAVLALARDPLTRNSVARLLDSMGQPRLFPQEFRDPVAVAAGDLVPWLAHPNELGTAPDSLEHTGRIVMYAGPDVGEVTYSLFRFRMGEGHWAAKDGWMAGVAGPYRADGERATWQGSATFSRFEGYDTKAPEEHVRSIHEIALARGLFNGAVGR
jgi:hypothetical protein